MNEHRDDGPRSSVPPTGPWGPPRPDPINRRPPRSGHFRLSKLSTLVFAVILLSIGIRMYRDLSGPDAWAYWKDQYFSPSLTSSLTTVDALDGSGRRVDALVVRGRIGAAAASWLRDRLDEAHLAPGDLVLLSSPGGDLGQAIIMGEVIRARGLATAVGTVNGAGKVGPSYCASACVLVFAGGKTRFGVEGSRLGVHRFVTTAPGPDPVAETQRTAGIVLSYFNRMGVSSTVVEAMSATSDIRWLSAREAAAMKLVTTPVANS